jgi:hypothetical protein
VTRRLPRTSDQIGTLHIEHAARTPRRTGPDFERDAILSLPRPHMRDVPLPEPVDTRTVNGRPVGGFRTDWPFCLLPPVDGAWEEPLVEAARTRERAAELAMLGGLL